MSLRTGLLDKTVPCPACGSPIIIPEKSGTVICESCDYEYNYKPGIKVGSFLKFTCDNGSEYLYEVTSDIVIGKNKRHILTLSDPIIQSIKEIIPIRTAYVSKNHVCIRSKEKYEIIELDGEQYINRI